MVKLNKLFEPGWIGTMEVKNRIVMAPMGTSSADAEGFMTEPLIHYFVARAKGGTGLLISEGQRIVGGAAGGKSAMIHDDKYIPSLAKLAQTVHQYGAKMAIQLHHPGKLLLSEKVRQTEKKEEIDAIGPSPIPWIKYGIAPREATREDIKRVTRAFAEAARRVKEAGFDAVHIHGGHGYLISSFLSPFTNRRTDEYGGSVENRARFACEVVAAVREKVGRDFPIIFRFSGSEYIEGGTTIEDSCRQAPLIVEAGADALDVSASTTDAYQWQFLGYLYPDGAIAHLAQAIKKVVKVPIGTVGKIGEPLIAERILEEGRADFIYLGRALLADPDWPNKAREGRLDDIRHCIYCNMCAHLHRPILYGDPIASSLPKSGTHCTVNPALFREKDFVITSAPVVKKVMVIGGGLAGMEAARVLAERGHQVTLYEKSEQLGGQWNIVIQQPGKENWAEMSQRLIRGLHKSGVKVMLKKEVTRQLVAEEKPDAVVVATGAMPVKPTVLGVERKNVVQADDVITKKVSVGQQVVVVGGHDEGMEVAYMLAEQGKKVSLITRSELGGRVDNRMERDLYHTLRDRLIAKGVALFPHSPLFEISEKGVYVNDNTYLLFLPADTVVLAVGKQAENRLVAELTGLVPEIYNIGDSVEPRKALYAIREGADIGRKI